MYYVYTHKNSTRILITMKLDICHFFGCYKLFDVAKTIPVDSHKLKMVSENKERSPILQLVSQDLYNLPS